MNDARRLRDAAFELLQRSGVLEETGGKNPTKVVVLKRPPFQMLLRTPFTKLPLNEEFVKAGWYRSAREQRAAHGDYGLDIWRGRKVFSVIWSMNDELQIVSFKRGAWEQQLLKLCLSEPK